MSCESADLKCYNGYAVDMGFLKTFTISLGEDITGRVFHFDVKETKTSAGYLLQLTNVASATDSGLFITDAAAGDLTWRLNSADSLGLTTPGNKPYECYYVDGGEQIMLFQGHIEFTDGALA